MCQEQGINTAFTRNLIEVGTRVEVMAFLVRMIIKNSMYSCISIARMCVIETYIWVSSKRYKLLVSTYCSNYK